MKKLFLLFFIPVCMNAQIKTDEENYIYYEEIIEVDKSSKELHDLVEEWIVLNFNDSNHTIKLNKEDQIIVKGTTEGYKKNKLDITFNFGFKDGKYRILMQPILMNGKDPISKNMGFNEESHSNKESAKVYGKLMTEMYSNIKENILRLPNSLKNHVNNNKESDW